MRHKMYLDKAKNNKADEFLTTMPVVEEELMHYTEHFRGKVVYCNTDHPSKSNFVRYFIREFNNLGLKRLCATHYVPFKFDDKGSQCHPISVEINEVGSGDTSLQSLLGKDYPANKWQKLTDDGDFRSSECVEILEKSDIVVTNPPFAPWWDYFKLLMQHGKKFLIMGNHTAVGYKDVFPYIQQNLVWKGVNNGGCKWFEVPDHYLPIKGVRVRQVDGKQQFSLGSAGWYTNLSHAYQYIDLDLTAEYDPAKYPVYENYNAIEVHKYTLIPKDYDGVMGVPITFMDHYNPKQFKIVGFRKGDDGKDLRIKGKELFSRILIQRRTNKCEKKNGMINLG